MRMNWIFHSIAIENSTRNLEVVFIQREDQKQPFTQYDVSLIFLFYELNLEDSQQDASQLLQ